MGLTQQQVADRADLSKPYLSNIETGRADKPPSDGLLRALERVLHFQPGELMRLAHLARTPADVRDEHELLARQVQRLRGALRRLAADGIDAGVDVAELAETHEDGADLQGITAGVAVPVINKVTAGYPQDFTDLDYPPSIADEYVRCPDLHDPQAFAARVVGDSMEPDYREGDMVVFSPNTLARDGDDCFVRFTQTCETTFKRFYLDDEQTVRLQPLNSRYPAETHDREGITGLWPAVFRIQRVRR